MTTRPQPLILPTIMTTLTFDTLQLTTSLKQAGIPAEQAEAVVRVIVESQSGLVTNEHLDAQLEKALSPLRTDLAVLKWMMGVLLASALSLVVKAFF